MILITGFEPFGDQRVNASWLAVSALPDEVHQTKLLKLRLPCSYFKSIDAVGEVLKKHPDITDIVLVGEAGGSTRIAVEMIGVNYDDASIADNSDVERHGEKIDPTGPDGLFSTLPVREILDHLKSVQVPAHMSWSAGQFVCNHTLYGVVNRFQTTNLRIGFVHVPYTLGQAADSGLPGQSVEELTRGIEEVARYLASNPAAQADS